MNKLMQTYLLASLLGLGLASVAQAAATKFTDVQCRNLAVTGTLTSGGCTCTNISTGTLNAGDLNATYGVTGATATFTGTTSVSTATFSGTQPIRLTNVIAASGTPAAVGILAQDSSHNLYISTSTGAGGWQKVGSQ